MSTEGPARLRVAVICLCVAATASLVSLGGSLFRVNGAFADPVMLSPGALSPSWNTLLLIMAIAGVAGATAGLIVIHRARRTGWTVLLLVGTVLTAAHVFPLFGFPDSLRDNGSEAVFAVLGAGSVLVILGLLGAANWLIHTGARGTGCLIAGLALAGPPIGTVVARLVPIVEAGDLAGLRVLGVVLSGIGIVGALGTTILIPALRGLPEPEAPPAAITVVGGIAAAVAMVPVIVIQFARNPYSPDNLNPENPFRAAYDEISLMLGMTGLVIFVAGIGLAALLGSKSLGAALAVGLVLFAVPIPLGVAVRSADSRADVAVLAVIGLVLAGFAAASRWRAWFAGGSCALVGVVIVAMRPQSLGGERVSAFLAACLLVLGLVAVMSTTASGAAALADRTRIPAVLGTVAVVIQLGLVYAGTLVWHSGITGDQTEPGFEPAAVDPLTIASGIALLFGALLVMVLPLIRAPAIPTPAVPDAPPDPDQAVPMAR